MRMIMNIIYYKIGRLLYYIKMTIFPSIILVLQSTDLPVYLQEYNNMYVFDC